MINTTSLVSGYIYLQGNFTLHLPLMIALLVFVKVPSEGDLNDAFPGDEDLAQIWYPYAIALHGYLAVIQFSTMLDFKVLEATFNFLQ